MSEVATKLYYQLTGDGEIEVSSLKYAWDADEDSLAVAFTPKEAADTKARAVLAESRLFIHDKSFVLCDYGGINLAMWRAAKLMADAGLYYDYEKSFKQVKSGNSFFGKNFTIGVFTDIAPLVSVGENVRIGHNCTIESGVVIGSNTEIGDGVVICAGAKVGMNCNYHFKAGRWQKNFCGVGRLIIGNGVVIGANTVIQHGSLADTVIGDGTIIGNLVEIAHDVKIGSGCLIVSQVGICGGATIGNEVEIYGQSGVVERVTIGDGATVLAKSVVTKNVRAGQTVSGTFCRSHTDELRRLAKLRRLTDD